MKAAIECRTERAALELRNSDSWALLLDRLAGLAEAVAAAAHTLTNHGARIPDAKKANPAGLGPPTPIPTAQQRSVGTESFDISSDRDNYLMGAGGGRHLHLRTGIPRNNLNRKIWLVTLSLERACHHKSSCIPVFFSCIEILM